MSMQIMCSDACLSRSAHRSREGACTLISVATMYLGVPYIYLPTYMLSCLLSSACYFPLLYVLSLRYVRTLLLSFHLV